MSYTVSGKISVVPDRVHDMSALKKAMTRTNCSCLIIVP